jgi:hypothetical protein
MALQSNLFKGDRLLEACEVNDAAHVTSGARGDHVSKIQSALVRLDGITIAQSEISAKGYGPSTASAVLAFKKKRNIINRAYETQADNIVGKMTIAALDKEILAIERKTVTCDLPPETGQAGATSATAALVGGPAPITDASRALSWAIASFNCLDRIDAHLSNRTGKPTPFPRKDFDIANTHFHQRKLADSNDRIALLRGVRGQFSGIQSVLRDFGSFALQVPIAPHSTDFARAPIGGFHRDTTQEKIEILPLFKSCGTNCRAAMLIHECAHYVASAVHFAREGPTLLGSPDCPDASVKNPDGSCKKHPRNYRDLTPQEAALNACTYAAFAFHAFSGQDLRPGAFKINF